MQFPGIPLLQRHPSERGPVAGPATWFFAGSGFRALNVAASAAPAMKGGIRVAEHE